MISDILCIIGLISVGVAMSLVSVLMIMLGIDLITNRYRHEDGVIGAALISVALAIGLFSLSIIAAFA